MQIKRNALKQNLAALKPQVGIWNSLCSNIVADVLAGAGFDWALIDMEHAPNDLMSVLGQLQAYEAGTTTPVVRPPWNDVVVIKRVLDLGVQSLLIPMVQSADEARQAVAASRYAPAGVRGVGLSSRASRYGSVKDYMGSVHSELCVLIQVETSQALDRVEEIVAVEGVDGVFFGPADISADLGVPGQLRHESVTSAVTEGVRKVRAAGKPAGILTGDLDMIDYWLETGCLFVACGSDTGLLSRGAEKLCRHVAARCTGAAATE